LFERANGVLHLAALGASTGEQEAAAGGLGQGHYRSSPASFFLPFSAAIGPIKSSTLIAARAKGWSARCSSRWIYYASAISTS